MQFCVILECWAGGRHAVVLQARAKCFVLKRIRFHYISLQFNYVVCNHGLFQLILIVINRFGRFGQ